jgi:uncharacterized protein (TIGR03435 family)
MAVTEWISRGLVTNRRLGLFAAGYFFFAALSASGQAPAQSGTASGGANATTKLPEFEVTSIRRNNSGPVSGSIRNLPDGLVVSNAPLKTLLKDAYGFSSFNNFEDDRILGAPDWVKSDRYDIQAKVSEADIAAISKLSKDQRLAMIQPLLADRFKLKARIEVRNALVYRLVIAKNGPKLKLWKPGEASKLNFQAEDDSKTKLFMQPGLLMAEADTMMSLASALQWEMHRTVLDQTGLKGKYDFTLKWMSDEPRDPDQPTDSQIPPPDPNYPPIFTAIKEQLGLKLESGEGALEFLVIDHIERPSQN